MKVFELIEKLQKCNPELTVEMDLDWTNADIYGVYNYPDGIILSLGDYGKEHLVE